MSSRSARIADGLAAATLIGGAVLAAYGQRAGAPLFLRALGSDVLALVVVVVAGLLVGVPVGALAGTGSRKVDSLLGFTTDWIGTLPAVLLVAFVRPLGAGLMTSLIWLAALRSLEFAWVVRSALLRQSEDEAEWAPRSLGYVPLSVYVQKRLLAALAPLLPHAALTPLWMFVLDAVGSAAGLGPVTTSVSLGALAAGRGSSLALRLLSALAAVGLSLALQRLGRKLRLGRAPSISAETA